MIDQVIDRLEKSCVDFDFIDEESTTIASWVTFGQILGILNKLRPYVELGEIIVEAGVERDETFELSFSNVTYYHIQRLIQQIKEAE